MACGRNREYNSTYNWQKVNYTPTYYTPVNCAQAGTAPASCTCANYVPENCSRMTAVSTSGCCENNGCHAYNGNGFEWMAAMQASAQNRCGCGCAETARTAECCQKEQFLMDMLRVLLHMLHRSCGNCDT